MKIIVIFILISISFAMKANACESIEWIVDQVANEGKWEKLTRDQAYSFLEGKKVTGEAVAAVNELFEMTWKPLDIKGMYRRAIIEEISCSDANKFYKWRTNPPEEAIKILGIVEDMGVRIGEYMAERMNNYYSLYHDRIFNLALEDEGDTRRVVVAVSDLSKGEIISTKNMAIRQYTVATVYTDAIYPVEFGYYDQLKLLKPLKAGDQLRKSNVSVHPNIKEIQRIKDELRALAERLEDAKSCKVECEKI